MKAATSQQLIQIKNLLAKIDQKKVPSLLNRFYGYEHNDKNARSLIKSLNKINKKEKNKPKSKLSFIDRRNRKLKEIDSLERKIAAIDPGLLAKHKADPQRKFDTKRYCKKLHALLAQARGKSSSKGQEQAKSPRVVFYLEYIHSKTWAAKKAEFKASSLCQKKCYVCGARIKIDIHHDCYDRLGHEDLTDLLELCRSCHSELHRRVKARVYRHITGAAEKMRVERQLS